MVTLSQGSTVALLQSVGKAATFDSFERQGLLMKVGEDDFTGDPLFLDHINPLIGSVSQEQQLQKFKRLLVKFQDIFVWPVGKLGLTHLTKHCIDTGNHVLIKQRPRRLPIAQREIVQKKLDNLEGQGLIELSDWP